jgi:chemotaxis-related protein WspD
VKPLPTALPGQADCWNQIGVRGDRSCPELAQVIHCHNCPVFTAAGRQFLNAPAPPGYLEEWAQRLAAPIEAAAADWQCVVVFRISEEWLALPVQVVVEVTDPRPVHRIPQRGAPLAGLVNIRGELHLCLRLDELLGITARNGSPGRHGADPASAAPDPSARLVVVRRQGEGWVFPVDEVDQVHRFSRDELTKVPATLARSANRLARGIIVRQGRFIGCLDDARLFQALRTRIQ